MATYEEVIQRVSSAFDDTLALNVLLLIFLLTIISYFIWKFYKSLSKRNLIELNLKKYNTSNHPLTNKLFAILFYLIEYVIVVPLLIALWFAALSFVLLVITEEGTGIDYVLLISATVVGSVRILAYFNKHLSEDLAKLFPFISLSVFLLTLGNSFNIAKFTSHIGEIPLLLNNIFSYIVVISFVEVVLRFVYTIFEFWKSEEEA